MNTDADDALGLDLVRKYNSVKLTTSNYMMFAVSFRNNVGSYGDVGMELIHGIYKDFNLTFPFKTKTVTEPCRDTEGIITEQIRDWDPKLDGAGLINDRKIWKESKIKYHEHRGIL
jgi:hypothetical protein